ncbi:glucose--fructose oxidoreductase precursor [Sinorhizobium sp. KGO-5]|nr:glucose--fructose oxidoreductase precursor [Sinorhizobium sp. KGO-5]
MASRRFRLGMVGGGQGAFFGAVHRRAAAMTHRFEFVAGALSSDPTRALESADALYLDRDRSYTDFAAMAAAEAGRDDGIDLVAVVTPNHIHAPASLAFLASGISVMCDKPLTATLPEALEVEQAAKAGTALFGVSYTNAGFDMVREARAVVESGAVGEIRLVRVEFPQEWLASATEAEGNKQAEWRTDPKRSGAGSLGDIGTHAFHLAEFISGLQCIMVSAEVDSFVPGRQVDDNVSVQLRFENGAKGSLWASQWPSHRDLWRQSVARLGCGGRERSALLPAGRAADYHRSRFTWHCGQRTHAARTSTRLRRGAFATLRRHGGPARSSP